MQLIAYARANPDALRVAYAGTGTPQHVLIELFTHAAGVRLTLVPYSGSAQALADLLDARAHVMFDSAPSSMPRIQARRLIALATTSPTRAMALPEVPALAGVLPGFEGGSWFGVGAPRGTPAELIARLNTAVNESSRDEAIRHELAQLGGTAIPGSAAAFGSIISAGIARYGEIIRAAGIRAGGDRSERPLPGGSAHQPHE